MDIIFIKFMLFSHHLKKISGTPFCASFGDLQTTELQNHPEARLPDAGGAAACAWHAAHLPSANTRVGWVSAAFAMWRA